MSTPLTGSTEHITLALSGMTCGHCVAAVTRALGTVAGASVEHVGINTATVAFDPQQTSRGDITRAIEAAGYGVIPEQPQ